MSSTARAGVRRTSIRRRILAIATIPSLLLIIVGTVVSGVLAYQGADVKRFTNDILRDAPPTSAFSVALMLERRTSELAVVAPAAHRAELAGARQQVDTLSVPAMAAARGRAAKDPEVYTQAVEDLGAGLERMPALRAKLDAGRATLLEVDTFYSTMISAISKSLFLIGKAEPVPDAAVRLALSVSLFQATDVWINADGFALAAASGPGLTPEEHRRYAELLGGARTTLDQTVPLLDAPTAEQYTAMRKSPSWTRLAAAHDVILQRVPGSAAEPGREIRAAGGTGTGTARADAADLPDEKTWAGDTLQVLGAFGTIGTKVTMDGAAVSGETGQAQLNRSLLLGLGLLLLAVVVLVVTTITSRGLIRRLTTLRSETLLLANERLPNIVGRLRTGQQVDVETELPPLNYGTDEIGQVADAFDMAQRTAVAAAVREAETRAGLRTVFLDIAHRSQAIVHRQLKVLDQAERAQEDPDQLALLFQLDHLSTRARRNAENLIILGGGQAGRQWRNPVPLMEIVRSAIGEAEDYVRVQIAGLPRVAVQGTAVGDAIHLLAELVDNATSFSPPMSRVEVRGNLVGRGIVIEVEDQGLGIEPEQMEELNRLLHEPPDFQVMALTDEPRLGLFVVAQLAMRHGIRVTLTPSPAYGGTRVVVLLPGTLIATDPALEAPRAPREEAPPSLPGPPGRHLEAAPPLREVGPLDSQPLPTGPLTAPSIEAVTTAPEFFTGTPSPAPLREVLEPVDDDETAQFPRIRGGVAPPGPPAPGLFETPLRDTGLFQPREDGVVGLRPYDGGATPFPAGPFPAGPPPRRAERVRGFSRVDDPAPPPDETVRRQPGRPPLLDQAERVIALLTDESLPPPPAPGDKPELPRRTRQTHLSPRLRDVPEDADQNETMSDIPDAEHARSRMSALQRGTLRGRATDPEA